MGKQWVNRGKKSVIPPKGDWGMNTKDFVERVQKPYKQVWTIVLLAQKAIYSGKQEDWELYATEADRYAKEGLDNPFQSRCAAFVYDAVDDLKRMNQEGQK